MLVVLRFEQGLGTKLDWKTFTCAAKERVDVILSVASHDHDVARKIRHVEKEGITIKEIEEGGEVLKDLWSQIDDPIQN